MATPDQGFAVASRQLAVAGNLGAGKTTLVTALSTQLGWGKCPTRRPDPAYVERIHAQPQRWSFEAQLNFLVLKASAISEALVEQRNVVIDRSIYEDRHVMAPSWSERYWDAASRATYESSAAMLTKDLKPPDVVVYCRCSLETRVARRRQRPSRDAATYDEAWVRRLDDLYSEWLAAFDAAPLLELDTEAHDVRDPQVVARVVADLQTYFAPRPLGQGLLFDPTGSEAPTPLFEQADEEAALQVLRPLNEVSPVRAGRFERSVTSDLLPAPIGHPAVYLAAPFSAFAVPPEPLSDELRLPIDGRLHGLLPDSYRRSLERIAAALEQKGYVVVVPHRDVNGWGRRTLAAEQVTAACIDLVRECDFFVGILGDSFGAHAEAGAAVALRKPCAFFEVEELGGTFIGAGFASARTARRSRVARLDDVAAEIARSANPLLQDDLQEGRSAELVPS